jgi:hypothetical protein
MKNKRILIALLVLMLGTAYSSNAQSSIDKKQKQDLERIKKRREELLMKAQQQQRQANEERRPPSVNSNQQTVNTTLTPNQQNTHPIQPNAVIPKQSIVKQPVLNSNGKKKT